MGYLSVRPWYEPRKKIDELISDYAVEMTTDEQAFLCGLIHEKRPEKILEIGVAEGGGTLLMAVCLNLLRQKSHIFSVDLFAKLYIDDSKETGYVYKNNTDLVKGVKHTFLSGATIAEQIEKVGADIDMAILDTTHYLPGELLDFICILPYLKDGAIVILHDTRASVCCTDDLASVKSGITAPWRCCSTQILFSVVKGKKYFDFNNPNIAAIEIGKETREHVNDVIMALGMTWGELLREPDITNYMKVIEKQYDEECRKLFQYSVRNNQIAYRNINLYIIREGNALERFLESKKLANIVVWGIGEIGKAVIDKLMKEKINVIAGIDKKVCTYRNLRIYDSYRTIPESDAMILAFPYEESVNQQLIKEAIPFFWIEDICKIFHYDGVAF